MFCVLWIGSEVAAGREVQEVVSMASIAEETRKIRKENIHYICKTAMRLFMAQSGV